LTSDPTNAKIWLNKVHNRAGLTDTVDATLDNIKKERALEFVGEGKRYWDLIRWGDAPTVLGPDAYGYRTNTWSESKKYLPIPQSEIDAAQGTLKQNNY
ncbi:MAG: RagB/SusD family nutrient uptake outer membrane protein, partial [Bacteroidales bacterium]|nr:RagB/SusD family nutrient uptake outer membrane protein [Bacteroidales bacterium]